MLVTSKLGQISDLPRPPPPPPRRSSRLPPPPPPPPPPPRRPSSRRVLPELISTRILVPQTRLKKIDFVLFVKENFINRFDWLCDLRSVQSTDCVFSIARIFKFNKGKAWWISRNPHVPQLSIFAERSFNFSFGRRRAQISNINFAFYVPFSESRHLIWTSIWTITAASWRNKIGVGRKEKEISLKLQSDFKVFTKIEEKKNHPRWWIRQWWWILDSWSHDMFGNLNNCLNMSKMKCTHRS